MEPLIIVFLVAIFLVLALHRPAPPIVIVTYEPSSDQTGPGSGCLIALAILALLLLLGLLSGQIVVGP